MSKFNVDVVKIDMKSKDVSIEASAKETFCFLRGTKMKVRYLISNIKYTLFVQAPVSFDQTLLELNPELRIDLI